jgi:4-diphosphocytidyl-2-C-methyl-D-erythritol kinase
MVRALVDGGPEAVAAALHNDLERPAFDVRPELRNGKRLLLRAGALGACVSGSGPTLFAIARDGDHALQIRDRVRGEFDRVEVVPSARTAFKRL